jgi:hypothetical protein
LFAAGPILALALLAAGCTSGQARQTRLLADADVADQLDCRIHWQTNLGLEKGAHIRHLTLLDGAIAVLEQGNILSLLDAEAGTIRWRRAVGRPDETLSRPTVYEDHVIICSELQLFALRLDNGRLAQAFDLQHFTTNDPQILHGQVVLGSPEGLVFAQTMRGGFQTWRYQMKGAISTEMLGEPGNLFVADQAGQVAAINPQSGNIIWRTSNPPWERISAQPAASGAFAFVASEDQKLYAFDRASGNIFWQYLAEFPLTQPPVVIGDRVYQRTPGRGLVAIDLLTGKEIWRSEAPGQPIHQSPDALLVRDGSTLRRLDVQTGVAFEQIELPRAQIIRFDDPEGGNLYLASHDGRLMKLAPR